MNFLGGNPALAGQIIINGHDYTRYVRQKTGLAWGAENTNAETAGRDEAEEMHTDVTSNQRTLSFKMMPMPFSLAQQLAKDLIDNPEGVKVTYPDIYDGFCTKLFYNTKIKAGIVQFTSDGILVDDISFDLITVKEANVDA